MQDAILYLTDFTQVFGRYEAASDLHHAYTKQHLIEHQQYLWLQYIKVPMVFRLYKQRQEFPLLFSYFTLW